MVEPTARPWFLSPIMSRRGEHGEAPSYHAIVTTAPPPAAREHVVDLDFGYGAKANEANAQYIVKAANAHDDLLFTLRRLLSMMKYENKAGYVVLDHPGITAENVRSHVVTAIDQAEGRA